MTSSVRKLSKQVQFYPRTTGRFRHTFAYIKWRFPVCSAEPVEQLLQSTPQILTTDIRGMTAAYFLSSSA